MLMPGELISCDHSLFLKVIRIEKKAAQNKVTKLTEEAQSKVKGKGKGKGKAPASEDVVALEAQVTKMEGNCIRGTMTDKTVDLLQVCLQRSNFYFAFQVIYTGLLWKCHPGPHQ